MQTDVAEVLIGRRAIARRIRALARQIAGDFRADRDAEASDDASADGGELTLVPILTGSIIFVSDLIRCLPFRMKIRLISVSSYPGTTTASKGAHLREALGALPEALAGAHVLVIDDILDSGHTLSLVTRLLRENQPATLRTCVLLRKRRPEAMRFAVDYVGFDIPDEFVVGYGLDFNDYYRNLPEIVTLRPEVLDRHAKEGLP
jgi:hypoxanthine phosphoribosyltransferase